MISRIDNCACALLIRSEIKRILSSTVAILTRPTKNSTTLTLSVLWWESETVSPDLAKTILKRCHLNDGVWLPESLYVFIAKED